MSVTAYLKNARGAMKVMQRSRRCIYRKNQNPHWRIEVNYEQTMKAKETTGMYATGRGHEAGKRSTRS
jgi:hypothetical protein